MKMKLLFRITSISLLSAGFASSQTTRALYDFADSNTPREASIDSDPDTTASNFDVNPSGLLSGSGTGPGYSSSSDSAFVRCSQTLASDLAGAIANDQYSSFTVSVDNSPIDLGLLKFRHFVTLYNSSRDYNVAVLCSLTGFTADDVIETIQPSTADSAGVTSEVLLTDPAFTAISSPTVVEFRFYYFDDNDDQSNIYRIDDVELLTQALPDPLFDISVGSMATDLVFADGFSLGSDLTKTITYEATSFSGSGSVTIDSLAITGDASHSTGGFSVSSVPAVPTTLADGETIAITVTAESSQAGSFQGSLLIDTTVASGNQPADALDTTLDISSRFFTVGDKLNANGPIEGGTSGWGGFPAYVEPGIAPNSNGMFRVKGEGDPVSVNAPDSAFQAAGIPDGTPDFELTAYFSPLNAINFENYTGITASGDVADRTFQWFLLSSDAISDTDYTDAAAAATLINLAYLPDGNTDGGTPDFYLFDGTNWVATGIGAIEGSIDNDADPGDGIIGDGLLDTSNDPLDIINVYRLSVKGRGFGTPSASYDISVVKTSGPDAFTSGSATSLTIFHSASGTTETPAAYGFTTADRSIDTNPDDAFTTSFWIDDVCYNNVEFLDPSLSVEPSFLSLSSHNGSPETATGTVEITNSEFDNDLTVTSIALSGNTGITLLSPPTLPAMIAPGMTLEIEVIFDPSLITPATAETASLLIETDAATDSSRTVAIEGVATSDAHLLANCDFESVGSNSIEDTDTFSAWTEGASDATRVESTDVSGLVVGSNTAAYLNRNTVTNSNGYLDGLLGGGGAASFNLDLYFAISAPTTEATATEVSSRMFNLILAGTDGQTQMNIRFVEQPDGTGTFQAFQGDGTGWVEAFSLPSGTSLNRSLATNGDGNLDATGSTKHVYRLKLNPSGIGSPNASYALEVFDTDGTTSLGRAANLTTFQSNVSATEELTERVRFTTINGGCSSFWVDEVCASIVTVRENVLITDCSYEGPGSDFVIQFTGAPTTSYEVESSADLQTEFTTLPGVTVTTDPSGAGTATVPATSAGSGRNFFRIIEQ